MAAPAPELTAARKMLVEAQTEHWRLKNERLRGELISVAEHQQALEVAAGLFRAEMLALPGKIALELGLSKADALRVDRTVREALNRLADGGE